MKSMWLELRRRSRRIVGARHGANPRPFLWHLVRKRLEFLRHNALLSREERTMLDLALFAGFLLFCLLIAYERLTHRL